MKEPGQASWQSHLRGVRCVLRALIITHAQKAREPERDALCDGRSGGRGNGCTLRARAAVSMGVRTFAGSTSPTAAMWTGEMDRSAASTSHTCARLCRDRAEIE